MRTADALESFLNSRRAMACAAATVRAYDQELRTLFFRFLEARGVTEMEDVTVPLVLDYLAWTHQRGVSASTLNSYRRRLCAFLAWCGTMGWCQPDMPAAIPKARERHYIRKTHTQEEVQAVLRAANDPQSYHPFDSQELTALILLLLDTGLRAGELVALNVGDLEGELIKVRGKGEKERWVRISELTRKALAEYLDARRHYAADSPLFINRGNGVNYNRRGGRLARHALYRRISRLGVRAGVATSAHMWRHTFAVFSVRNGANLKALQHFLGHSSLLVTDAYLRGFGYQDAAREHERFSPVGALMRH